MERPNGDPRKIGAPVSVVSVVVDAHDGYDDDGDEFLPAPSPADRTWRHPAELHRDPQGPVDEEPVSPRAPDHAPAASRRSPWAVGFVSVVGSAVLAGSLMFTVGGIGDEPNRITLEPLATLVSRSLDGDAAAPRSGPDASMVGVEVATSSGGRSGNGVAFGDGTHVLTTRQLVDTGQQDPEIVVIDGDGRTHEARLVLSDPYTDLAVLWTAAPGLAPLTLATAGELEIESPLTAVGSGRGAGSRTWTNSIEGVLASVPADDDIALVAVASITDPVPAESAGAVVFDESGNFAGMLSVDLRQGTNEGLQAVVIPANQVKFVVDQFRRHGAVNHGWLGIESRAAEPVTTVAAESDVDIPDDAGAPIENVVPNSPAASAGLRSGDILVDICDHHVASVDDIVALMLLTAPGTPCGIAVLRDGQEWGTTAIIGERETVT